MRAPSRQAAMLSLLAVGAALAVLAMLFPAAGTETEGSLLGGPGAAEGASPPLTVGPDLEAVPGARSRAQIEAEREAARKKPEIPRTESVYGFVFDGRGKPVAGADVRLLAVSVENLNRWGVPDPEPLLSVKSAEDGAYLAGPAPEGPLKVRAEAPGFAPTSQAVGRRGTRVDLILDVGGALKVAVQDPKGESVAEAKVIHTAGSLVTALETDAAGRVAFPSVPTGSGSLLALKEGFGAARVNDASVAPGETRELTMVLTRPLVLTGRVVTLEGERPIAGAAITIRFTNLPAVAPSELTSGEDGSFRQEVSAGNGETFEILVEHPEHGTARQWLNIQDAGGGAMTVVLKVGKTPEPVFGRVVGPDGQGAEGVLVTYANLGDMKSLPETRTEADGEFELPLPPGAQPGWGLSVIGVSDSLGVGAVQIQLNEKQGSRRAPVLVKLSGTGSVEGRVLDAAGEPVAGALVSLSVDWSVRSRGGMNPDWMMLQTLQDPRRFRLNTVSGADGTYAILSVPASSFRLGATFGLDQVMLPNSVDVPSGGVLSADLTLGEGGTIEGIVVDEQGRPVGGAYVSAGARQRGQEGYWWGGRNVSARSQTDGTFVLRGVTTEGSWSLRASAAGYQSNRMENVQPGSKGVEIRMIAMGWIPGVLVEGGRPYRGPFTVTATPVADDSARQEEMRWNQNQWPFNTDDGRFLVRGLHGGTYLLSATTPEGSITIRPEKVVVSNGRASAEVTLSLGRGAVVGGSLTSGETGEALVNAHLWLNPKPGRDAATTNAGAQTDAQGRFLLRGLAAGTYVLYVNPPSGMSWQEDVELREGEVKELSLVERRPGKARIYVVDPEGRPLARAMPQLTSSTGNIVWPSWQALQKDGLLDPSRGDAWDRALRTDENGVNLRHHVPPGRYRVTASLENHVFEGEAPWIDVHSGRTTDVTVVLKPSGG